MDIKNFNSPKLTGVNTRLGKKSRRKHRRPRGHNFIPYACGLLGRFPKMLHSARLSPSPPGHPDPLPDIRNLNSGLQCVLLQDIKKDRCLEKYLLDRQVAGSGGRPLCWSEGGIQAGEIRAEGGGGGEL